MNELQMLYCDQIEEIVEVCRRSGELGFGAASGGNVSFRVAENVILITPTGIIKRNIVFDDICIVNMEGQVLYAKEGRKPTGEMFMHLYCLKARPDVTGIMHAHPPYAIGMSLTAEGQKAMILPLLPESMTQLDLYLQFSRSAEWRRAGVFLRTIYSKIQCIHYGESWLPCMQHQWCSGYC